MSKNKQIEEMTEILKRYTKKHNIMASVVILECYAEELYNAGYRKQSENMVEVFCKVGDTVYQTDGIRIYELEVFDVSLRKGKPYYETESIDFDNTAIGKSIFLTKEEAEAKMKGANNG